MTKSVSGRLMIGLPGETLSEADAQRLQHAEIAGVILFDRNYRDPEQLTRLCAEIRAACPRPLLIAVDHEGGRVQRFREGFTRIPPMAKLGQLYPLAPGRAQEAAVELGWLLGRELLACGVDFSFTPVADLGSGRSEVIGDRAFAADPLVVGELAGALVDGLREAGMAAVAKHFPGHGNVVADSHLELPVDDRDEAEIRAADLLPFEALIRHRVAAVMPAHVVYPAVDEQPAGFSPRWLQQILRDELGFAGAIISDDLDMAGAAVAGNTFARAEGAVSAGCDLLLLCNDFEAIGELLPQMEKLPSDPGSTQRLNALRGHARGGADYRQQPRYVAAQRWVKLLADA